MWNIFSCISWPSVHLLFRSSIHFFILVVYFCRLYTFLRKDYHEQIWTSHSAQAEGQRNTHHLNDQNLAIQTDCTIKLTKTEICQWQKRETRATLLTTSGSTAETSIWRTTWQSEVKSRKWELHSQPQSLMCNNVHSNFAVGKNWKPPKWLA